jgi:hypothetical protein
MPAPATDPVASAPPPSEPAPTSEPVAQPSPESLAAEGSEEPTTIAEAVNDLLEASSGVVAAVVERTGELAGKVAQALGALLGGGEAPQPIKDAIERVADVVGTLVHALGALLGGDGAPPVPIGDRVGEAVAALAGRVGAMASEFAQALGALLGGGGSFDPSGSNALAQAPAFLYERTTALVERSGELVGELTQAAAGALYGSGAAPERTSGGGSPVDPPVAPIPVVPAAPGGGPTVPLSGYSSFANASGSSADGFQPLFAVVMLVALALLQGGKLFWANRESLRPNSAHILAIERPG